MPEEETIQVVMSKSFVVVNQDNALDAANQDFVIVRDAQENIRALLDKTTWQHENRAEILERAPTPISVSVSTTIEQAVRMTAKDLVLNPKLPGLIVLNQGTVVGVIPREQLAEQVARSVTRSGTGVLEGSPLGKLVYECPIDHQRIEVDYFDPASPPRCDAGHLMDPVD